ncbi:uncharacterized protein TNCV_2098401 [Trichonephila clavipes]|nr:uncharacterized protein TNCV_2098401 [Trichonephila clavipes]
MMSRSCGSNKTAATCHTARATIDLLKDTFCDRLISRFGPVNWPPRSCGLTPLEYFQWGYAKSLVYADKPQTLDHLEHNIHRVIADIRPQMLEKKVIENWRPRLDYIRSQPWRVICQKSYIKMQEETGGRQREKSLDSRHRRLDDRYRFYRGQKTARWWSVCTTLCTVCTFNACPSEKAFSVVPGTPELEKQ